MSLKLGDNPHKKLSLKSGDNPHKKLSQKINQLVDTTKKSTHDLEV
jgi:hypothetical protein